MGYNSRVTGDLEVQPALSDKAVDELGLREAGGDDTEFIARREGEEEDVALVNGIITVVPGNSWTTITPRYEEPYKAYSTGEELEKICVRAKADGCEVNGAIYLLGEEEGDISRFRIENNVIYGERPELVWPNGDRGLP